MLENLILILALTLTFPIITKTGKNKVTTNNDYLTLQFHQGFKNLFLGGSILLLICMFILGIIGLLGNDVIEILIVFLVLAAIVIPYYLHLKTKYIVVENDNIHLFQIFRKEKVYNFQNIEKVIDHPLNNFVIYTKDNQKFGVDYQMENFKKFEKILNDKNIHINYKFKNKHPTW